MSDYIRNPFKIVSPVPVDYAPKTRKYTGIPSAEILPSGRLFVVWYCNHEPYEGKGNFVVLATSTDGGHSWREIACVIPEGENTRAYDSCLWLDPLGNLWFCWTQGFSDGAWKLDARAGVWAAVCSNPDTDNPVFSHPHRIGDGVMLNKPTVLKDGRWIFPNAVWGNLPDLLDDENRALIGSGLSLSSDNGKTFQRIPGPQVPDATYNEHVMIEKDNGDWHVFTRTRYGIGLTVSQNQGKTWLPPTDSGLCGADSRFALRRLKSGNLLFISHQVPMRMPGEGPLPQKNLGLRVDLTAWLSTDDGKSWHGRLLLDARAGASFPDFCQAEDGTIFAFYDYGRITFQEILFARFTENDVLAGTLVSPESFLANTVFQGSLLK